VCISSNPRLHCGWRDSDQPPSQDGFGGDQLKAGDKLWVDAQMIEILKGHNLGRKFRLNTGVVEVAGDIYTDDTMVPKELNVKIATTSHSIIHSKCSEGHVQVVSLASELNLE
jgi:hypothetical protein